jgi:putative ABC transport system permease protein
MWKDIRYGARVLFKNPTSSVIAVVTLALGIGANTAIFSSVNGVLLKGLPYTKGDELVILRQEAPLARVKNMQFSVHDISDLKDQNSSFSSMVEYHSMAFILYGKGEPERVRTGVVSANFFDFFGVKPILGRTFRPGEDEVGAEPVLILSYEYWKQNQGGDRNIVGTVFRMNDKPHTVIGVLPPVPQYPNELDVYMPVSACPFRSSAGFIGNRDARMMDVFCRVKPDVSLKSSQADMDLVGQRLEGSYPQSYPANQGYRIGVASLREELTHQARPTLLLLLGVAGLVLLITCANVANIMLARLLRREREMAVRTALGASRGQLLRQMVVEGTILSVAGGALGLVLAYWGSELLAAFVHKLTPRSAEIRIDAPVLLFTLGISVVTGLVFGALPALGSNQNLVGALKDGSTQSTSGVRQHRIRSLLLVSQVTVCFVLLVSAGLMLRSLDNLQKVDPGFNPESVLTLRTSLSFTKYTQSSQVNSLVRPLLEKVYSQPGVLSAAVGFTFPLNRTGTNAGPFNNNFTIQGRPNVDGQPVPAAEILGVSADYFKTLGIKLAQGRGFTSIDDNESAPPVGIINQSMARHRWPDQDPIGAHISFDNGQHWVTVIGIAGDVKQYGLASEVNDQVYVPFSQNMASPTLLVRTAVDPMSMAQQFRDLIHEIDPDVPVFGVRTVEQARADDLASPRVITSLLGIFALLALIVTCAGIGGVVALSVSQRTNEIGIRMALGATSRGVLRMVLQREMVLVIAGIGLGVAGAIAITRLMSGLLFGTSPTDFLTFACVAAVFAVVAVVACLLPARRATRIDPLVAFRST